MGCPDAQAENRDGTPGMARAAPSATPDRPGFETLDFSALWKGRERVTKLETEATDLLLRRADTRRVLEVGLGAGRITPLLHQRAGEYVGIDVTPAFLPLARGAVRARPSDRWAIADVTRLPVVPGAFTTIVMIRVFNFLRDSEAALHRLRRALVPGGTAIISYHPHPTLGTLVDDLKVALQPPTGRRPPWMTFARADFVEVRPSSFPARAPTREAFHRLVSGAGFRLQEEVAVGFEDNRFLRALPSELFSKLGQELAAAPGFPHRIVRLVRDGGPAARWPDLSEIFECTACGAPLLGTGRPESGPPRCSSCHREVPTVNGVPDLRGPAAG